MKRILMAVTLSILGITYVGSMGCGGGGVADEGGSQNPPSLFISSVKGDETPTQFKNSLIVDGTGFEDGMDASLISQDNQATDVQYALISDKQIEVEIPAALEAGDYELSITLKNATASQSVSILKGDTGLQGPKGDKGDQGAQGIAGNIGLLVTAEYSCGLSGDIDNTADNRAGQHTNIIKYSDGSYSINCLVQYLNSNFLYIDSSNDSEWLAANSVGVANGTISCIPYYVTAVYSIPNNSVTYVNQADNTQSQTVACSQVYP